MSVQFKTIIFDLDGTLLNTIEDIADSVNYALKECGFPERTYEEVQGFVGNATNYLLSKSVPANTPKDQTEECTRIYKNHYRSNMDNKTAPYDNILDMLKKLKDNNYKIAVVSNKFDSAVKELCKKYFSDYIEVAIGESGDNRRKPAPDTVFAAIKELGSDKEECIYVGDSDVDVQTAHNTGIPCIGVTWGFRGREVLVNAGADYIIDTPSEIFDIL